MKHPRLCSAAVILWSAAALARAAETEPVCGGVTGDPVRAVQVCTRIIEFGSLDRPELAKAYYSRGTEWANQGNHDRAIADFNVALELDPRLDAAHYNRALSHSHKGQSDAAVADYDAAIRIRPRDLNAYLGRAAEHIAQGAYTQAAADFDHALRLAPRSFAAYFGRGRARFYAGEFRSAASDLHRAHQLEPGVYPALWLFLARRRAGLPGGGLAHEARTTGASWPGAVVGLYLGRVTPDAVMRAASHPDGARQRELRCEASFYIAHWHILKGAREPAALLLREAQSLCPRTFIEREGAAAELRRMQ